MGSWGIVVVDDNHVGGSSTADHLTPLFDTFRSTAYVSPAEEVTSIAIAGAEVAAVGVDVGEIDGFAQPVRADASGVVQASAGDSTAVEPPAPTAQELTHI